VLLHRAVRDARLPAHNMPAVTCLERRHQLIPITFAEFRSAQDLALCARAFEASLGPLTDLFAPELWQRGEGRQEEISGSFSVDKCSSVNDRNATPCQARRCRCPTVAAMPSRLKRSSDHTSERLRERRFVLPLLAWGLSRDLPDYRLRATPAELWGRLWVAGFVSLRT
jgi:hypothetical protein